MKCKDKHNQPNWRHGLVITCAIMAILRVAMPTFASEGVLPVNHRLGGGFTLDNVEGQPVSLSDFKGQLVLLNFGYTSCPDICPMVLNRLGRLMRQLDDQAKHVQPIFISFDPERDTAEKLEQYVSFFDRRIIALTGTNEAIAAVAKQYGAVYIYDAPAGGDGLPRFSHSDYIYLLDQQGRVRQLYATDANLSDLQADIVSLLNFTPSLFSRLKRWWEN